MKILVLTNNGMGLYKFRKELLEELVNRNHEVYISFPNDEYVAELEQLGCKFVETQVDRRGTNPFKDLKLFMRYLRIIKQINPDVVLTYTIKPNIYGGLACRLLGVPFIVNITGLGTAVENRGILQSLTLLMYKPSINKAKCVFFQNEENKKFLLNHNIAVDNHKLLPGSGVNLEHFYLMDYPSDEIIRFLFIGRVMKEKGIDYYLDAAQYIKEKYPNTEFHVIGNCEEDYDDKLKRLQDKNIIRYHGKQDDVREFLKISHCTIHPTYYPEGMSNVLLESAACGRPLIATDRSGCREIVDDGINGFLVKQHNSKDLIQKIEKFINLDYKSKRAMGLAGRKKMQSKFDRNIIISSYLKELKKTSSLREGVESQYNSAR